MCKADFILNEEALCHFFVTRESNLNQFTTVAYLIKALGIQIMNQETTSCLFVMMVLIIR